MSVAEPALGRSHAVSPARPASVLSGPVIGLLIVLGLFIVLIGIKGELQQFLSLSNLQVLVQEGTIPAVVALGALLVIVSGGIDLSVGSVAALVTVVTMQVYRALYPESVFLASLVAVPAGVLIGGACGLANGLIITRLRVAPFVATLGMLGIARGLAVWLAERKLLVIPGERPDWVKALEQVHAGLTVFNPGFWSLALLATGVAVLLRYMVLGRYCYAIGSNEAAARLCGVPIGHSKVLIYTLAGLLTGWAGVLLFAHGGGTGDPSGGEGLELRVIAAVVIGGASLSGGRGTVVGTLLGVLILEVLGNGVSIFNVPIEVQHILIGVIIIGNTALSRWQQRRTE
jgi:ribose/xylose/arabinose/galactoside ABC-type transport system permease subunit